MRALDDEKVHFFKSYFADHDLNSELDSFAPDKYAIAIKEYISSLPAYLIALNEKTINYFKELVIKYNEKSDEDLEEIVKSNIKNQLLNKVLNIGTR